MNEHSCIYGHLHDWRLHITREADEYAPEPPRNTTSVIARQVTHHVYDTWYCTRCRKLETTEREVAA